MTLQELICLAQSRAAQSGIAETDYWFMLTAFFNMTRSEILLNSREAIAPSNEKLLLSAFSRMEKGEPPQYIVGKAWFRNLELTVNPAVLIPRPETELLIDILLPKLKPAAKVLEIGTGSGAIAIALKNERSDLNLSAAEISESALQVATENALLHRVQIDFVKADLFPDVEASFDCLVSNPPYLSSSEMEDLDARVKDHEPQLALWGGEDGLAIYRRILSLSGKYLNLDGFIALEHGYRQKEQIMLLAAELGWTKAEAHPDLNGIDRFLVFSRN